MTQEQQQEETEEVIEMISDLEIAAQAIETSEKNEQKDISLNGLVRTLVQAQQWERANQVIEDIEGSEQKTSVLKELGIILTQTGKYEELLHLIQQLWSGIETRKRCHPITSACLWVSLFSTYIGIEFCEAYDRANQFLLSDY